MDFGVSFEAIFRLIRRFILVVWAKNQAENGPNATRKAPPILFPTGSWQRSLHELNFGPMHSAASDMGPEGQGSEPVP